MTCVVQTHSMAFVDATGQLVRCGAMWVEDPLRPHIDRLEELGVTHDGHDLPDQTDGDRTPGPPCLWLV